ncbi:MAG TPA: CoA pyrophosphatase, partial [Vicinamibacterales bacterium]|nr:CoA pyrophosphatase [Vicinamibacterales bacterium]
DQRAHVVLTVRSHAVRHAGQVSLPGGVIERGETMQAAALREAREEIGLELDGLRVLGALSPIDITVSGFRLHPIVAARQTRPDLKPTDSEVARILEVDVAALTNAAHFSRRTMSRDGRTLEVPTFDIDGAAIWGATAMVLAEFLTLLGWPGPPDEER